jgi:hypothetical protein
LEQLKQRLQGLIQTLSDPAASVEETDRAQQELDRIKQEIQETAGMLDNSARPRANDSTPGRSGSGSPQGLTRTDAAIGIKVAIENDWLVARNAQGEILWRAPNMTRFVNPHLAMGLGKVRVLSASGFAEYDLKSGKLLGASSSPEQAVAGSR